MTAVGLARGLSIGQSFKSRVGPRWRSVRAEPSAGSALMRSSAEPRSVAGATARAGQCARKPRRRRGSATRATGDRNGDLEIENGPANREQTKERGSEMSIIVTAKYKSTTAASSVLTPCWLLNRRARACLSESKQSSLPDTTFWRRGNCRLLLSQHQPFRPSLLSPLAVLSSDCPSLGHLQNQ